MYSYCIHNGGDEGMWCDMWVCIATVFITGERRVCGVICGYGFITGEGRVCGVICRYV